MSDLIYDKHNVKLYRGNSTEINLESESVRFVVTSPPYNVGVNYDGYSDDLPFEEYWSFTEKWMRECYRLLQTSGRIVVNVPNTGNGRHKKKGDGYIPYLPYALNALSISGFTIREVITWVKSNAETEIDSESNFSMGNTAWGSWMSPSNPSCRSLTEFLVVAHKGSPKLLWRGVSDIEKEDFMKKLTRNVWVMPTAHERNHPAAFHPELPRRAIQLYTYVGDTVLDPFCGTATTNMVASKLNRPSIGIEQSAHYLKDACARLDKELEKV